MAPGELAEPPCADMENQHPQSLLGQHRAALGEQLSTWTTVTHVHWPCVARSWSIQSWRAWMTLSDPLCASSLLYTVVLYQTLAKPGLSPTLLPSFLSALLFLWASLWDEGDR